MLFPEVVNDDFLADAFEDFLDEIDVHRVDLVFVLGFLVGENNVQSDLVALVHDRAFARSHFADVKAKDTGDGTEILFGPVQEFFGGIGLLGVGPKDHYV